LGLGQYFEEHYEFHKHVLLDIYEALYKYALSTHADDDVLLQLIYLDYYRYNKIKPKDLFGIDLERKEHNRMIANFGLDIHNYRYSFFPVSFNIERWMNGYELKQDDDVLIVQFTGREEPMIMSGREITK
jgi:hypothetical protein